MACGRDSPALTRKSRRFRQDGIDLNTVLPRQEKSYEAAVTAVRYLGPEVLLTTLW